MKSLTKHIKNDESFLISLNEKLKINKNYANPLNSIAIDEYKHANYIFCFHICYSSAKIVIIDVDDAHPADDHNIDISGSALNAPGGWGLLAKYNGGAAFYSMHNVHHYILLPLSYIRTIKDNFKKFITTFSKKDFTFDDFESYLLVDVKTYFNEQHDISPSFDIKNEDITYILNFIENFEE